jgi:hypothetical protein
MMASRSFAEVLEARLPGLPATPKPPVSHIATGPLFHSISMPWWPGASAFGRARPTRTASLKTATATATTTVSSAPRTARVLSPTEADALQLLAGHGAMPLMPSFTVEELKRTFRRAARAVHPDTHAGASEAERRRCAEAFVAVRQAYVLLLRLTRS